MFVYFVVMERDVYELVVLFGKSFCVGFIVGICFKMLYGLIVGVKLFGCFFKK